jgi:hypothetical protein
MRQDRRGPGLFGESGRFEALLFDTILTGCAVYHPAQKSWPFITHC